MDKFTIPMKFNLIFIDIVIKTGADSPHVYMKPEPELSFPESKVHEANMGTIWGRQNPSGPHVGPMNIAIWVFCLHPHCFKIQFGNADLGMF